MCCCRGILVILFTSLDIVFCVCDPFFGACLAIRLSLVRHTEPSRKRLGTTSRSCTPFYPYSAIFSHSFLVFILHSDMSLSPPISVIVRRSPFHCCFLVTSLFFFSFLFFFGLLLSPLSSGVRECSAMLFWLGKQTAIWKLLLRFLMLLLLLLHLPILA